MILADKIIYLRKKFSMTQEELASKVGVSRQSVSKWESTMSMPDLDKIIKLSNIFGVSTDFLLNDDLDAKQMNNFIDEESQKERVIDPTIINDYFNTYDSFAKTLGAGISTIVLSVLPTLFFKNSSENLGIALMLLMVAIGSGFITKASFIIKRYEFIENEPYTFSYGVEGIIEKEQTKFSKEHMRNIIIAISLFILSPIIMLFQEMLNLKEELFLPFFIIAIALGVSLITYSMIKQAGFNDIIKFRDPREQIKDRKYGMISAALWVIVSALYLLYSTISGNRHISRIIWPIAAGIQLIINSFKN